ncbi:pseudouridine synthase family protein [Helicobacter suis]|uniref:pseudouridine synthase family protein n=1 Tax=Helicobacter suis TaxID=104628 RepID=UPI0013D6A48B|nr:RNA pseudouridine synthase [Helicobacter suis]
MPFVRQIFEIKEPIKAWKFVANTLRCSVAKAQSHIDRGRLQALDQSPLKKSQNIQGLIALTFFKALPSALYKPFFSTPFFEAYYKPKNLYSHPKNYHSFSLYESVYSHNQEARLIHRLDYETSGIILVSQNKEHEKSLRALFSNHQITKTYTALVQGNMYSYASGDFSVILPILEPSSLRGDLGVRSQIHKQGKFSATTIKILCFDVFNNQTLLQISPLTGRTHQIRLHLSTLGFPIVGEPLYTEDNYARAYLDAKKQDFKGSYAAFKPHLALEASGLDFTLYHLHYSLRLKSFLK